MAGEKTRLEGEERTSVLSSLVYGLVGLSGLYQALTWKSIQRRSYHDAANARA